MFAVVIVQSIGLLIYLASAAPQGTVG